jgi:sortase A
VSDCAVAYRLRVYSSAIRAAKKRMAKKICTVGLVSLLAGSFLALTVNIADAQDTSNSMPAAGFVFTQNLSIGTRGNDVAVLQRFLIAGGYLKISTSTGYFGPVTAAALGAWQASVGISPSVGYFGPVSREKINTRGGPQPITATKTPVADESTGLPVRLTIPKLNIDATVEYLGLTPQGSMAVPAGPMDVAWFDLGPRPGENGSAVIAGHEGWKDGIWAVFDNLYTLHVGDKVYIEDEKNATTTFVVSGIRTYDQNGNATDVFSSSDGKAHLNLITCEGTWNAAEKSYSNRLVVFTDMETK